MDYSIKINKDRILAFKLPIREDILNKYDEVEVISTDIDETDKKVEIQAILKIGKKREAVKICYDKEKLDANDYFFIGWSYFSKFKNTKGFDKSSRDKAKEYLIISIKNHVESCIPYYILAEYPFNYIEYPNTLNAICYAVEHYNDICPELFTLIYKEDKNNIRGLGYLKKGLQKFPDNLNLLLEFSEKLIERQNYKEALGYLLEANICQTSGNKNQLEKYCLNILTCFVELEKFADAEDFILKIEILDSKFISLLLGLLNYYKKNYKEAINYFIDHIQSYNQKFKTEVLLFLLSCYLNIKDIFSINDTINLLFENLDEAYEDCCFWGQFILKERYFKFENIAEKALRETLSLVEIEELEKIKVEAVLALFLYLYKIPVNDLNESKRKLTDKETTLLKEIEELLVKSLEYFPKNSLLNTIISNTYYLKCDFDKAKMAQIKNLKNYQDDYFYYETLIKISDCSEEFIDNYLQELKEVFYRDSNAKQVYIQSQINSDVENLYNLKKYKIIAGIYRYLRSEIDLTQLKSLFELAYSLAKTGYNMDAIFIYEKEVELNDGNSAVFNNLALLFEKEGEVEKAIDFITKAKELDKDDIIASLNYERLIKQENNTIIKEEKGLKKEGIKELVFDEKRSLVIYGNKKCPIPIGTNQYYVCKVVFNKPIGTQITEEDIFEVLEMNRITEKDRTIYDTCRAINKKIEDTIGIKSLLTHRRSLVWIREELIS